MNFLRACLPFLMPHWRWVILILLCAALETAYVSFSPLSFQYLIDEAFIPKDIGMFTLIIAILLAAGAVGLLAGFGTDYAMAVLSGRVAYSLRRRAFAKIQRLPLQDFDRYGIGTIAGRFSSDIPSIGGITAYLLPAIFKGLLSVLIGVALLIHMQWMLTVLMMIGSTLLFLGPLLLKKRSKHASEQFKQVQESFIDLVDESVKGHRLVKGFQLADFMEERARAPIQSIWKIGMRMNLLFSLMERIPAATLLLLSAGMISAGGYLIIRGELSVGAFIAMNTVFLSVSQSIFSLSLLWPQLFEAEVSLRRVNELLHNGSQETVSGAVTSSNQLPKAIQDIQFINVKYRYTKGRDALKGVSLTIPAGGYTVFVGPSGSGKSTALQLLLRFIQPSEGNIYYGEMELNQHISESSLYEQAAVVFQDSYFLQMSIKDNLILGNDHLSMKEVEHAAKLAQIHETIMAMPQQYDTPIIHNGNNLSGGQKQRLAIARALTKNPNYLLLDEACSALDPATESDINEMLEKLRGSKTIVSVTHRLASAVRADRIYVFQDGGVVEYGTHAELLEREGAYRRLWDKQNGFEISSDGFQAKVEVSRLAQFPFFAGMDAELLTKIGDQFMTEKYESGQTVIHEGEEGDKFYLIARGTVEVLKGFGENQRRVAVLQDGDHFGEIALLRNIPRTATILARVPSVLLSLRREQLLELVRMHRGIYESLERSLKERISS